MKFEVPGYEEGAFGISLESDIVSDRSDEAEDGGVSLSDKDVYTFPELIAFRFFFLSEFLTPDGESQLSTATLPQERWVCWLYSLGELVRSSPSLENPKNAVQMIAQKRTLSGSLVLLRASPILA